MKTRSVLNKVFGIILLSILIFTSAIAALPSGVRAVPAAPTITSPGSTSGPGPVISTLTPTLYWNASAGADYYAIGISKYPYGTANLVYNPQVVYGTSHTVPSGYLVPGEMYRWNMQARDSTGWSAVSNTLYFQTPEIAARIDSYYPNNPSSPVIVVPGSSVSLSVTFTNTGNLAWNFIAGISIWNSSGTIVGDYSQTLSSALQPNQQTTVYFTHTVSQAGDYWVQFGVWKATPFVAENLLDKKPSPSERLIVGQSTTEVVSAPNTPTGPSSGNEGQSLTFYTSGASSNLGHSLQYRFSWGDGTYSAWSSSTSASHSWSTSGTYTVRAQARCATHTAVVSSWSDGLNVTINPTSTVLLPAPSLISPSNGATGVSTAPTFSWTSVSGANRYWLTISTNQSALPTDPYASSAPGCIEHYTSNTNFTLSTPLAAGTTYYWQVQAFNDTTTPITQGHYSSQRSFITYSSTVGYCSIGIDMIVDFDGDGNFNTFELGPYGGTAEWIITVWNDGDSPLFDVIVIIVDVMVTDNTYVYLDSFYLPELHPGDYAFYSYLQDNIVADVCKAADATANDQLGNFVAAHSEAACVEVIGSEVGRVVLTEPLDITPSGPYSVGDTLTATFTVENQGNAEITLDKLLLGGRYNGGELPGGGFPDFTYQMVTLQPGQEHPYEGTFTIPEAGIYDFFIAYYIENPTDAEKAFLDENNWNTCIELGAGLTDADRTRQIEAAVTSPDIEKLVRDYLPHLYFHSYEKYFPTDFYHDDEDVTNNPVEYDPDTWPRIAYAHAVEGEGLWEGYLVIQYWFYYAYDFKYVSWLGGFKLGDTCLGSHEHDWESFFVFLKKEGNEYTPKKVTFFGHGDEQHFDWDDPTLSRTGTHTKVYVARGSHAGFPAYEEVLPALYVGSPRYSRWSFGEEVGIWDFPFLHPFDIIYVDDQKTSSWPDMFGDIPAPWHQPEVLEPPTWENYTTTAAWLSPVNPLVIDPDGRRIGVDPDTGDIVNEIPGALYSGPGTGPQVVVIPDTLDGAYSVLLVGTDDGHYTSIAELLTPEGPVTFVAIDIPVADKSLHQYTIDWEALSQGEKGVTLQIDEDGDGVFDRTIIAGATLQPPVADSCGPYTGDEGSPITFDASGSFDPDGYITLYEWDFTGDGIYDVSSVEPTASWTWGDDYTGTVTLRVTDDDGMTSTATTSVTVLNVAPTVNAGPDQTVECGLETVYFSGSFTDPGWLDTHTFHWDFGDGTTAEGSLEVSHLYTTCGTYTVTLTVTDKDGGVGTDQLTVTVVDTTPPDITMLNPLPIGCALQDMVTFKARATDVGTGVDYVTFSIREANGASGWIIGSGEYEDMAANYDPATDSWELLFQTLQLPDGYYLVIVKATDNASNTGSITVPYSIRNWAVIELLPATETNNPGRTMPIKFSLRVAAAVDPEQPFVYNEDLTILVYGNGDLLQTSTFGDGAQDYRIDTESEHYITNFQTLRNPMEYTVEIWRGSLLIDDFDFETARQGRGGGNLVAAMAAGLLLLGLPLYFSRRPRRRNGSRCPNCGYPIDQSRKWESYSKGELVCRACWTPLDDE